MPPFIFPPLQSLIAIGCSSGAVHVFHLCSPLATSGCSLQIGSSKPSMVSHNPFSDQYDGAALISSNLLHSSSCAPIKFSSPATAPRDISGSDPALNDLFLHTDKHWQCTCTAGVVWLRLFPSSLSPSPCSCCSLSLSSSSLSRPTSSREAVTLCRNFGTPHIIQPHVPPHSKWTELAGIRLEETRLVTCGLDGAISIWRLGCMKQPIRLFRSVSTLENRTGK
ncbi:unnamed protein product [Protopolystoma xenopodis]|uniref:Uncharacterized protein n=1 Tax=Protopolystoma xenopodis TaxID=117903 RepID=A0A3S5CNF9_9PLAT|nr:unnamed protein product [Protopolystoma xenopodis]